MNIEAQDGLGGIPFGTQTTGELEALTPRRRLLLARCRTCHRGLARLVVDREHLGSVREALATARWAQVESFIESCPRGGRHTLPDPSTLASVVIEAYRKFEERFFTKNGVVDRLPIDDGGLAAWAGSRLDMDGARAAFTHMFEPDAMVDSTT